jgi:hypothetical protein
MLPRFRGWRTALYGLCEWLDYKEGQLMILLRVRDPKEFVRMTEAAMDCHLATSDGDDVFLVVGCRVAIRLDNRTLAEAESDYLSQPWLRPVFEGEDRIDAFESWLKNLTPAPELQPVPPAEAWKLYAASMTPVPHSPLPPAPVRPAFIYGHLPFVATTLSDTLIYRWEAFPKSLRIIRTVNPPTIAADTYAAPSSEVPFALTGFAAVARFALPNLMPACFRYELQPLTGTVLECGASVPLYGQSGGGVEVMFRGNTDNRCSIADPVVLPAF